LGVVVGGGVILAVVGDGVAGLVVARDAVGGATACA
jgi:hypothetical protein